MHVQSSTSTQRAVPRPLLDNRQGTATDHNTRLAMGYDWQAGSVFPLIEIGYHLTQVRGFDEETLWWP